MLPRQAARALLPHARDPPSDDWKSFQIELEEVTELGERALIIGRIHALARSSGVAIENEAGFVMDFRNALIVRLVSYSDPGEARREAGT